MDKKVRLIAVSALALLGALCITSGVMYHSLEQKQTNQQILVVVQQKQISNEETIEIKLKNFELEMNTPLSVKILDYLDTVVTDEVLANLKLDTSSVNVTQPGTYQYVITNKKKKYTGTIVIKEKQVTAMVQTITLKTFNIKKGTALSNDISNYVIEPLTEDIKATMTLDLSKVNININGDYTYYITYNNSIYQGKISVSEDQNVQTLDPQEEETPPVVTPTVDDSTTTPTTP